MPRIDPRFMQDSVTAALQIATQPDLSLLRGKCIIVSKFLQFADYLPFFLWHGMEVLTPIQVTGWRFKTSV